MASQDHPSLAGNGFQGADHHSIYNRRFTGVADQGPPAASSSSSSSSMSFAHRQHPQPPRDEHPRPYQGRSAPFPLPTNKRSLGGLAALDEHQGPDIVSALLGNKDDGRPQPAPLGKTRCYWALLSYQSSATNPYDMTFVYADPVLQSHLATEADDLIGKSFFDFVHPNEKQRAKEDMQNIVSSRTLFGSVTRCRYWRVPAIRKFFGNPNPPIAPESHLYVEDDLYLPIDVVLNMVSDSLALCFFHAIINKSIMDNSETDKTDWTNWCGTARELFDVEQCNKLWSSVIAQQQANKRRQDEPAVPPYVFQILSMPNAPTAAPGSSSPSFASVAQGPEILFSWPPPRLYRHDAAIGSRRDEEQFHEAFEDGSYFADDFAKLAVNVQASPSARTEDGTTARNGDPGTIQDGTNTSCTRRFRAKHTLTSEGMLRAVESVLVPYGSIMFACFSTTYQQIIQHHAGGGYQRAAAGWPQHAAFVDGGLATTPQTLSISADGPPRKKTRDARISPPTQTFMPPPWASGSGPHGLGSPSFSPDSHLHHAHGHSQEGSGSSNEQQQPGEPFWPRPAAPSHAKDGAHQSPPMPSNARLSDDLSNSTDPVIAQATAAASLFAEINPETGEKRCTSCGTSNSPEWRKGPTGTKTLCNACGLRFSRSINRQSKKEEKARKQLAAQQAAIDVLEGRAVMKQKQSGKGAGSPGSSISLPASQALYAQQALTGEQPFFPGMPQPQSQSAAPTQPQVKAEDQSDDRALHRSQDGAAPHYALYDERGHAAPAQQQQHHHHHQPYPSDPHAYYTHPGFPPPQHSHAAHYQHGHPTGPHGAQQQQHHQDINGYGAGQPHSHDQNHLPPVFHPYPDS